MEKSLGRRWRPRLLPPSLLPVCVNSALSKECLGIKDSKVFVITPTDSLWVFLSRWSWKGAACLIEGPLQLATSPRPHILGRKKYDPAFLSFPSFPPLLCLTERELSYLGPLGIPNSLWNSLNLILLGQSTPSGSLPAVSAYRLIQRWAKCQ